MLFGSNILEVAVGLTFLYVLLALICSALNEWIAGILSLRSKTLREGIANLLEDPNAQGLAKQFFEHPLVKGLARKGKNDFPSYIPASTFVAALFDITFPSGSTAPINTVDSYERIRARLEELAGGNSGLAKSLLILLDQAGISPNKIREATLALQQVEQVRANLLLFANQLNAAQLGTLSPLAETLEKFQALEGTLREAEAAAKLAFVEAQGNVERYFDEAMQRVSGWYKRRVQIVIIVLAVLVTGLLNADTIVIGRHLSLDPELRARIVGAATQYVQQQGENQTDAPANNVGPALSRVATPVALNALTDTAGIAAPLAASTTITPSAEISETLALLTGLGLPLGWSELPATMPDWVYKLAGLFVTVVAVSLGAPFWFEVLNRLVNLRMTGGKPAAAPPAPENSTGSVLESRMFPTPSAGPATLMVSAITRNTLTDLALRAVQYVEGLKQTRTLTIPERDIAMAWMLVETTNQDIPATPDEIVSAIDQALRERARQRG
jgi:hypothetical protein